MCFSYFVVFIIDLKFLNYKKWKSILTDVFDNLSTVVNLLQSERL